MTINGRLYWSITMLKRGRKKLSSQMAVFQE